MPVKRIGQLGKLKKEKVAEYCELHAKPWPDLIAALKSGQVGSAGLDVYEEETDYFFEDYSGTAVKDDILARLMTFPNVMITSHQAFFTEEALANIANITLKNIELFFSTGAMPNGICNKCDGSKCSRCPK